MSRLSLAASAIKDTNPCKIAFIRALWHEDITMSCQKAFLDELLACGYNRGQVEVHEVPGAYELPLLAKRLASTGNYDAIVANAFVIDGGIYRHDFVASSVVDALMRIQLEVDVPIFSAVLTPHHYHATTEHSDFFLNHFALKGKEAAHACLSMVGLYRKMASNA